jgi:hypothetical protein
MKTAKYTTDKNTVNNRIPDCLVFEQYSSGDLKMYLYLNGPTIQKLHADLSNI